MLRNSTRNAAIVAFGLLLSACVPTTPVVDATGNPVAVIAAPASVDQTTAYLATADNGFTVPTVPVEQVPATYRRQIVDYPTEQALRRLILEHIVSKILARLFVTKILT